MYIFLSWYPSAYVNIFAVFLLTLRHNVTEATVCVFEAV